MKNKKGSIEGLQNIGWALVLFGIIIALGLVLVTKLGDTTVICPTGTWIGTPVINETGWLNSTGYTLTESTRYGFSPTLTELSNMTDGKAIPLANATIVNGVMKNATASHWNSVNLSYTYTWDNTHTWNTTTQTCLNPIGADSAAGTGTGYTTMSYIITQMGTTGLAGWIPVIIVVVIAGLVLALFRGRGRNY